MNHAVAPLRCPRCPSSSPLSSGTLHRCATCDGTWIDERALAERVGAMQQRSAHQLAWIGSSERTRLPCAVCREPMDALLLLSTAVDRCTRHGVWFDKHELSLVLERSAHLAPRPASGTADFASALEVADLGVEIAIETPGVIDALLDVVGAIFSAIDI